MARVFAEIPMTGSAAIARTRTGRHRFESAGALHLNHGSEVLLENVTVSGNASGGAAILNDGFTRLTIVNSTITANHGRWDEQLPLVGGIQDVHGGFGQTFLSNTILAGNGPAWGPNDCTSVQSLGGGNLIGLAGNNGHECRALTRPDDLLDIDPGLGPLADNGGFARTHQPGPNVIDRGATDGCLPDDQRSIARPQDGDADGHAACDIGAVEFTATATARAFADGFEEGPDRDQEVVSPPVTPQSHSSGPDRDECMPPETMRKDIEVDESRSLRLRGRSRRTSRRTWAETT